MDRDDMLSWSIFAQDRDAICQDELIAQAIEDTGRNSEHRGVADDSVEVSEIEASTATEKVLYVLKGATAAMLVDGHNIGEGDTDTERIEAVGSLVVTTKRLVWISSSGLFPDAILEYPQVFMHAICKDSQVSDEPCLYCHVSKETNDGNVGPDNEDENQFIRIYFTPSNSSALQELFQAVSKGASLCPSQVDAEDESLFGSVLKSNALCESHVGAESSSLSIDEFLNHMDSLVIDPLTAADSEKPEIQ